MDKMCRSACAEGWETRLFGSRLVKCDDLQTADAPERVLAPAEPFLCGVYFSFANINSENDDYKRSLLEFYKKYNAECGDGERKKFEVIQVVLWTRTDAVVDYEESFGRNVEGLPWYAVPFEDIETKRRLTYKYRIKVCEPTLVVVKEGGTEVARPPKDLLDSPEHFPWIPRTLEQILCDVPLERCGGGDSDSNAEALGDSTESTLTYADLPQTCITAFYFAAHWCPPCKAFTPQLAETYAIIRRRGHDFRIIFVSSDRSEESYQISCSGMPWLSVGFSGSGGERARRELALALRVQGIPALRIFPPGGGAPIDARHQVIGDPDGLNFPWKPGPVSVLTEHFLAKMQEHPAIVLFVDGEESEIQFAESVLLPAAGSYFDEYSIRHPGFCPYQETSPDEESIDFEYPSLSGAVAMTRRKRSGRLQFLIAIDTDASDALREQTGADDAVPLLTAIDFPGGKMAVMKYGEEITTDSVQNFLDSYLSGQLEYKSLPQLLLLDEVPKEDLS